MRFQETLGEREKALLELGSAPPGLVRDLSRLAGGRRAKREGSAIVYNNSRWSSGYLALQRGQAGGRGNMLHGWSWEITAWLLKEHSCTYQIQSCRSRGTGSRQGQMHLISFIRTEARSDEGAFSTRCLMGLGRMFKYLFLLVSISTPLHQKTLLSCSCAVQRSTSSYRLRKYARGVFLWGVSLLLSSPRLQSDRTLPPLETTAV
jgi:hypothetical protein